MNALSRFLKWTAREKRLFLRVLLTLYWVKFASLVLPFSKLTERYRCTDKSNAASRTELLLLKNAIRRASQLTFWRNKCLVETFVARMVLNNWGVKSEAYLSLAKDERKWLAHAWISVGSMAIVSKSSNFHDVLKF